MTFSYRVCINGAKTDFAKIKDAFRSDVIDQIVSFKHARHTRGLVCEITGISLGYDDADIDHTPPTTFASILDAFITSRGLSKNSIAITLNDDGVTYRIADPVLRQQWKEFHKTTCRLRVLSKHAHKGVHAAANDNKRISNAA